IIVEGPGEGTHDHMPVQAQNLVEQLLPEAIHDGHHDDERRDAQHDADEGKAGDDGNEAFLAPGAQITKGQQPLERSERPLLPRLNPRFAHASTFGSPPRHEAVRAASMFIAASGARDWRSPVARFFTSTSPFASPFGPTITCQGRPIRSAVLNFTPALSAVSS